MECGETLSAVGHKTLIDLQISTASTTAGIYVDSNLVAGGGAEIRYDRNGGFYGPWGSVSVGSTSNELQLEIEVTAIGASTDFSATLSGTGITNTTRTFSLATTSAFFGPVTYNGNGSNVLLDNFSFEDGQTTTAAVPEPSSFAVLALGAVGLAGWRRRRRSLTQDEVQAPACTTES